MNKVKLDATQNRIADLYNDLGINPKNNFIPRNKLNTHLNYSLGGAVSCSQRAMAASYRTIPFDEVGQPGKNW